MTINIADVIHNWVMTTKEVVCMYIVINFFVVSFMFIAKLNRKADGAQRNCGSVVECLTRDRGAAGSSLAGVTVLCP